MASPALIPNPNDLRIRTVGLGVSARELESRKVGHRRPVEVPHGRWHRITTVEEAPAGLSLGLGTLATGRWGRGGRRVVRPMSGV